ncbi:hypothetical protein M9458_035581, partial [Cirrhinus mrigala]
GHHLMWHINCLEMQAMFQALKHFLTDLRDRHVLVHRQHSSGLIHQPPGRSMFAPPLQAGASDPCVVPGEIWEHTPGDCRHTFLQSLCSGEFWRECTGTPCAGRAEYGFWTWFLSLTTLDGS